METQTATNWHSVREQVLRLFPNCCFQCTGKINFLGFSMLLMHNKNWLSVIHYLSIKTIGSVFCLSGRNLKSTIIKIIYI